MEAKLLNCGRCGVLTEELLVAGKKTKNCKKCRDLHNNRNQPILKCENLPNNGGFYKQEQINILEDKMANYEALEQGYESKEKEPYLDQDVDNMSDKDEEAVKVQTIRELLQNILKELTNNTPENKCLGEELTSILYSILEKVNNNKWDDFIKQQDLKNRIIINKLDALINAIT